MEFGPQTWSIDLVLVIVERGNLILGGPAPLGSYATPPEITVTTKMEIYEVVDEFFSTLHILTRGMST